MPLPSVVHAADADFSLMPELFPRGLRPHVRALGQFVRLADATADDPWLTIEERMARLESLAAAIDGSGVADWSPEAIDISRRFRRSLQETGVSADHALQLVASFRHDVEGARVETWTQLTAYCRKAAAPIGRHMIDLVGEDATTCGDAADALCAALRILKRLRDCRDPTAQFNRLCIPVQFMRDAAVDMYHLKAPSAKGQTRAVIDRVLDGVDRLLTQAAPLPGLLTHRGLWVHSSIVLCRARKLAALFRDRDPLRERVGLTRVQRLACRLAGTLEGLTIRR